MPEDCPQSLSGVMVRHKLLWVISPISIRLSPLVEKCTICGIVIRFRFVDSIMRIKISDIHGSAGS